MVHCLPLAFVASFGTMVTSLRNQEVRLASKVKNSDANTSQVLENRNGAKLRQSSKRKLEVGQGVEEEKQIAGNFPSNELIDSTNKIKVAKKKPTRSKKQKKTAPSLKDTTSPDSVDDDEKNSPLLNKSSSTVSFEDSETMKASICTSSTESDDVEENLTEEEILSQKHMRRRAAREVHSNRRMYFSRRMSRQMLGGQESLEFPPLRACTLSFSPPKASILKITRSRRV